MKLRINKKDAGLMLATLFLLSTVALVGWMSFGEASLIILVIITTIFLLFVLLELYRRLNAEINKKHRDQKAQRLNDYYQIESLFSLFFVLQPNSPWPETRGWAASPDLLKMITQVILTEKPLLVVEASSGVSTLAIAYCLKKLGKGKVVSLEHESNYAAITQGLISAHGLGDVATIVHAPLREYSIGSRQWLWYDTNCLAESKPIDLLVVDGPPSNVQTLSRYPALPLLVTHLGAKSTVILDDGRREDEKQIVSLWASEFPDMATEFVDLEKGAYILRRT